VKKQQMLSRAFFFAAKAAKIRFPFLFQLLSF